jgi:hypothetical protein
MTKLQRTQHKIGNQIRKLMIIKLARRSDVKQRHYWASYSLPQDGKHTLQAINILHKQSQS